MWELSVSNSSLAELTSATIGGFLLMLPACNYEMAFFLLLLQINPANESVQLLPPAQVECFCMTSR